MTSDDFNLFRTEDADSLEWAFLTGRRLRSSQDEFVGAVVEASKDGYSAADIAKRANWPVEDIEAILQRWQDGYADAPADT